ncbi:hypothetical protein [Marinobacterium weihaiense]|uniref:Uncharacterized protein n=1 Tax=Marinobacterium weihaiense TaxID=2851016 RepID=A0ABS6MD42_9GAMM|nr:hypothetical protein [Marinobacterium weihaiense]MBV0934150.1 hypothetical protein [Marinobacterium weihaiense]
MSKRRRITSSQIAETSLGSALGSAAAGTQGLVNTIARTSKYIPIDEYLELNPANARDELTFTIPKLKTLLEEAQWDFELLEQQIGKTDRDTSEAFTQNMRKVKAMLSDAEYAVFEDLVVLARTIKSVDDLRNPITYKALDRYRQRKQVCSGNHRVLAYVVRGFEIIPGTLEEGIDDAENLRREFIDNATHKELTGIQQLLAVKRLLEASGDSTENYSVRKFAFNYGIRNKSNAHRIRKILSSERSELFWKLIDEKRIQLHEAADYCELSDQELTSLLGAATEDVDTASDSLATEQQADEESSGKQIEQQKPASRKGGRQAPIFRVHGAKRDLPVQQAVLNTMARGLGIEGEKWVKRQAQERYGYESFQDKNQVQVGINLIIEYLTNNMDENQ